MSAMHWEARRRQQALDRRLSARVMQAGNQDKKKEESTAPVTPCEPQ
uniref:Si:dkey-11c5.11 n=1 Tax=Cyprinus carpio carpio TaxID=630221 RepID=A0A9J8AR04_CYPCA